MSVKMRELIFQKESSLEESFQVNNKLRQLLCTVEQSPVSTVITDLAGTIEFDTGVNNEGC